MRIQTLSKSVRRGFTLIEMVMVLAIISLLIGAGVVHLCNVGEGAKIQTTKMDMVALSAALEMYAMTGGRYPTEEQGLKALLIQPTTQPVPKSWIPQVSSEDALLDPWNNPYQYRSPGTNGQAFDLFSWGQDGIENGNDIHK